MSYRPNKNTKQPGGLNWRNDDDKAEAIQSKKLMSEEVQELEQTTGNERHTSIIDLSNVKSIGDLDCDYHIYLEDYVFTYLYQYAQVDLSTESSAVFLGEYYPESKEVIVRGIIPVPMEKLSEDSEWIDEGILLEIENERQQYFKNEKIIGWMHMQPGYGTMLTMKELREHRRVFGEADSIFMLVDAINKIETLYVYENEELKEQSGYYMYYERNEEMQKYMLEHPFVKKEEEVTEDTVVNQFREIGRLRKQEYLQRKNVNMTVIAASVALIVLTAVIVRMNDHKNVKNVASLTGNTVVKEIPAVSNSVNSEEDDIKFIINSQKVDGKDTQLKEAAQADAQTLLQKEEIKEQSKGNVKEEAEETVKEQEAAGANDQAASSEKIAETEEQKNSAQKQPGNEKINIKEAKNTETEKYKEYTVKEGDTLANISYNLYGSSSKSREIAKLNELGDTNLIRVGQTLKVPEN